jgi:hypothetical protein
MAKKIVNRRKYQLEDNIKRVLFLKSGTSTSSTVTNNTTVDSDFAVENVGNGAKVHRRTVDDVAYLRSLISADGSVTIVQNTNEIDLSVAAGGGTGGLGCDGAPDTIFVGSAAPSCGDTIYFTPGADIPGAAAGDLAVWIVMHTIYSGQPGEPDTRFDLPAGWNWLIQPGENSSDSVSVLYRVMSANDLTTTFSITKNGPFVYTLCHRIMVYRNFHPEYPFGAISTRHCMQTGNDSPGIPEPVPVFANPQFVLSINWAARNGLTGATNWPADTGYTPIGQTTFSGEYKHLVANSPGVGDSFYDITTWPGSVASDENLIPGETVTDTLLPAYWTQTNITIGASTDGKRTAQATAVSAMHYFERSVTLTAGQKYTFATLQQSGSGASSVMSIIDPSSVERGAEFGRNGLVYYDARTYFDPSSDLGTVWHWCLYQGGEDGSPSQTGGWCILYFTAPTTGTYKLRVYLASSYGGSIPGSLTFLGDGGSNLDFRSAQLATGYITPHLVETPTGAVTGGTATRRTQGRGWLVHPFTNPDTQLSPILTRYQIAINPPWVALPLARLNAAMIGHNDATADDRRSTDGLQTSYTVFTSDDSRGTIVADRLIYPTKDGVAGKYYFEAKVDTVSIAMAVGVAPIGCPLTTVDDTTTSNYGYCVELGGIVRAPHIALVDTLTLTNGVNDIWGVAVDYAAKTVTFYQNNVLKKTVSMAEAGTQYTADIPMRAVLASFGEWTTYGKWTLNLKGPFTYTPPTGHVAYDEDGSATANDGQFAPIESLGTGVQLASYETGDDGCNYIAMKTLAGGGAVTVTDGDTVVISSPTLVAGDGVTLTPDLGANTLAISSDGGSGAIGPDVPPASPNAMDDEFDTGSVLDSAKWTLWTACSNGTPVSEAVSNGAFIAKLSGSNNMRCYYQPISGTWKFRCKFRMQDYASNTGAMDGWTQYTRCGMFCGTTSDSKRIASILEFASGHNVNHRRTTGITYNSGTGNAAGALNFAVLGSTGLYMEFEYASGTLYTRVSLSGHDGTWAEIITSARNAHLGADPDVIGIEYSTEGSSTPMAFMFEWFRRIS